MNYFDQIIVNLYQNIYYFISACIIIIHLICVLSIVRDLNNFSKHNVNPQMISSFGWIISTLIFGLCALFIYWIMHHSSLSR